MRQDNLSSVSPFTRPSTLGNENHQDLEADLSPAASTTSLFLSQLFPTPMDPDWSSSGPFEDGDENTADYDMTDAEDGGASLSEDADLDALTHHSDIISPLTGNIMNTTPFLGSHHEHDGSSNSIASPDAQLESPPFLPLENTSPPPPPLPQLLPQLQPIGASALAAAHIQNLQFQLVGQQAQLQPPSTVDNGLEEELAGFHPTAFGNPNPMSLGPDNLGLGEFLRLWSRIPRSSDREARPHVDGISPVLRKSGPTRVEYNELRGDEYDFQGINWSSMGVGRSIARNRRRQTYNNYVNRPGSDKWHPGLPDLMPSPRDSYFRFASMDIRRDTRLLHFQLRNLLGCASRTRVYYPSHGSIRELDPTTGRVRKAINFGLANDVQISTLAANDEVLVIGGFMGDYHYRGVNSEGRSTTGGKLTDHVSGITNHIQIHSGRRSSSPVAAFASNDCGFRTVDLATNQVLSRKMYDYALNCSAISMDQRLRVMVGDDTNVVIADAESGEVLQTLDGHRDFGFACDWAPDGWTVATGFQDKSVRIWDARMWKSNHTGRGSPLAVLRMDISGARSLRFSPLGSGKRLLVAAEEADIINVINAQTFESQQKLDVFGEIGGTAFTDQGHSLTALVCDPTRGGLVRFERCDAGAEDAFDFTNPDSYHRRGARWHNGGYDWVTDPAYILDRPESQETFTKRRRQAAALINTDPF
ncbi:Quino protein amine dehydrogenase [Xylariales sp. PMI_506]|nr:Quino protein amine dehydrogenase [Xylariales sp. PMI_506]